MFNLFILYNDEKKIQLIYIKINNFFSILIRFRLIKLTDL